LGVLLGTLAAATARAGDAPAAPAGDGEAIERRLSGEEQIAESRFVITPHKPNYLLPLTYDSRLRDDDPALDSAEIKFQLSFKIPLTERLFNTRSRLYFAYTQLSFFQAYNSASSAPFRETNYEPEFFWLLPTEWPVLGMTHRLLAVGVSHQSNGRSLPDSRSWNRVYANFVLARGDFYLSLRPWYRIPEDEKQSPTDARGDDNPDIEDYLGNGELRLVWLHNGHSLSVMVRSNLDSTDNRGAVQIDWGIPLGGKLRGYVQVFNGYGESLIDYNRHRNRIGIGVMLTDWL
jgi:phospholipase A1/A2